MSTLFAMSAKRPYSDACCLLDDLFDPLGVFEDDTDDAKRRKRKSIICAWSLIARLTLEDVRRIRSIRLPRSVHTWEYVGDIRDAIDGVHPVQNKNWSSYSLEMQDSLWLDEFRMHKCVFDELYTLVAPRLAEPVNINPHHRHYNKRHRLLITLNWLAHNSTSRQMRNKWATPHNTICASILRPTVRALHQVLVVDADTKVINWPSTASQLSAVVDGFKSKMGMPGCAGAIDGSLIPLKKPKKETVGGDADAFYGYKGFVSHLLLGVVDSNKLFIFVSAGAPACIGDAGLYTRSVLKDSIEAGCLDLIDIPLRVAHQEKRIKPYLVGDAAFGLSTHLLKNYSPTPAAGTAHAMFNKKLTNCRRLVEIAFGELKGRWAICKRNVFWGDIEFLKVVTSVCCALHNFVTERGVLFDDALLVEGDDLGQLDVADEGLAGGTVRDMIAAHVAGE